MIKRFAFFFLIVLLLSSLVFSIFQKLGDQRKVYQQPYSYFPPNSLLFMDVEEFSKTVNNFFETNMIWLNFEEISKKNHKNKMIEDVKSIISDSSFNEIFDQGSTNIAFYKNSKSISWIIAKNIYANDLEKNLNVDSSFLNDCYFKIMYPFLVASNSQILVNSFVNNFNNSGDDIIYNEIEKKMRFSSKMSKISCLINVDLSNELLDSIFINKELSSIVKTPNNKKWFQFDIDYAPKTIKIVAISNYDSLLTLNEPIFYSFNDWIPNDIEFIEKKVLEIKKDSNSQTPFIKCLNLKFKDEILERENDLIVLESPLNNLAKLFFNDSISESYSASFSSTLDTSKLKVVFPNFNFNDKQGFIKDHFLIIATEDGKKELEIKISQRNDSKFNNSIFVKEENEEFNQSHSQFSYLSQSEIIKNFNSPRARLDSIIFNLIKSIGGISWTVNNYDQRELHGINIKKFYPKKVDKKILWKTTIPKLIWGPYALNNHRTNTKDIIVQDLDNIIYLISAGGKIKWSMKLESKIMGDIKQVDAYKNNKFQMVFNTDSKLHIIDILGNEIDGFPIRFNYLATNSVSVLDYDKNKDYRFLIAGNDFKIHNYNVLGKGVSGWIYPMVNAHINRPLSHFAINGLDYIMAVQDNGIIKLYNRRGGERYNVNQRIALKKDAQFQIVKSYSIDSTALIFEDTLNSISKIIFSKGVQSVFNDFNDSLKLNNRWEIYSNSKFNRTNFGLKGDKKLKIKDQNNEFFEFDFNYQYQVISNNKLGTYLMVLNENTNEIQLIDSKYNINPSLFRATKMTCIDDINADNSNELVTIINNNVIVCYQIPSLN